MPSNNGKIRTASGCGLKPCSRANSIAVITNFLASPGDASRIASGDLSIIRSRKIDMAPTGITSNIAFLAPNSATSINHRPIMFRDASTRRTIITLPMPTLAISSLIEQCTTSPLDAASNCPSKDSMRFFSCASFLRLAISLVRFLASFFCF